MRLHFIDPGKPIQNAYVESLNGRFRDTCLNTHWFLDLEDARRMIEAWQIDYNDVHHHSSLERRPPAVYARLLKEKLAAMETEEIAARFPPSPQPYDEGTIPS